MTPRTTEPTGLDRSGRRRVTGALCLTQITSWGVLFYAFPVLAPGISADTGWGLERVMGAFTVGQLMAALMGIWVGRHVDRHGPRWLMGGGSVLAAAAVVLVARAPGLAWFTVAWLVAGAAMSMVLYPPAFAAITRWHGDGDRVRALTILTVAGGLASTVFAPLTATLSGWLGWRDTFLVLALVLAVVTVPAHLWGLRGSWPSAPTATGARSRPRTVIVSPAFIALVGALTLTALSAFAVVVNLVPLLAEREISLTTAGVVLGLGGVGQVVGRLGFGVLNRRLSPRSRTVLVIGVLAVTTAALGLLEALVPIVCVVLLAGASRGMFTLIQATAVTDRWGTGHYGQLTAVLTAPITVAIALAPWVGAQLAALLGSYSVAFLALAAVNAAAVGLSLLSHPRALGQHRGKHGRSSI
ncbi:MFS transporter [Ornithinimicrobium cavernae]|uniref:MFS transporter n=1 Tax=Ornithinimicrobium cavernae TaxID=2666047 RepID=UPI000D69A639|nr:MFS transporter [Ornithinimicrobium cavernae]